MANAYTFAIVDPSDLVSASIEAEIAQCAEYVIGLLGRYIEWQGTLDFVVEIKPASASPYPSANGILPSVGQIGWNGSAWVNQTLEECITGIDSDPTRPDAGCTIYLASDGTIRNYGFPVWFDPNPQFEVDPSVPAGFHDFVGIYTHEILHGLGFWPGTVQWDSRFVTDGGVAYFDGAATTELLGRMLPFEINGSHYGHSSDPAISRGIMYQWGNYERNRWDIGRIDLAVLEDLGHSISTYDGLALFELIDTQLDLDGTSAGEFLYGDYHSNRLSGLGGNDTLLAGSGDDSLDGADGDDTLDGGGGADLMDGGLGNDTYVVDNGGDQVLEDGAGDAGDLVISSIAFTLPNLVENLVLAGSAAIDGTGNALANVITGNAAANLLRGEEGDDRLDGGGAADTMEGGVGNDTFVVDHAADVAVEEMGAGTDTVESSATHALGTNVENLVLTGAFAINGAGNDLANALTGNGAANRLDGGAGADTMAGAGGNDTYVVDNAGDAVTELGAAGTDTVEASIAYTLGANVENFVLTGTAAINGTGNALANSLTGNGAANRLDGGLGADTMVGGAGDDTYVVDDSGDVVTEASGSGRDLVRSSVSFTLGSHVEKLTLTGTSANNGTGNALGNSLLGNSAANVLDGGAGADAMAGGAGNDTYIVDNAGDQVAENSGEGTDTVQSSVSFSLTSHVDNLVLTGAAAISATGNSQANSLTGNAAANLLNGGGAADTMAGAGGNDIYIVDNVGDTVTELAAAGTDLVKSSVTFTLGANVERLTLRGGAAINGTGNDLANTIAGNEAANVLDGGTGADKLMGAGGNDIYIVDNVADQAIEASSGGGTDTVQSSVSYTIGDNIEVLTLTGAAAINGTGNDGANTLTGNGAANILDGDRGNDILAGGAGDDTLRGGLGSDSLRGDAGADDFVFNKALGATNVDTILDFAPGSDTIVLENAVFGGLGAGALNANALAIGSAAADADDRIVYDPTTGNLYYDADGTGAAAQVLFAMLDNAPAPLSASDFAVI